MADALERAALAIARECLAVKQGEEALVICNPATEDLGEVLRAAAAAEGADATLAVIAERASVAAEPPATVAAAMKAADVVIAPTLQSISHTASRKAASEGGARIGSMPGATADMVGRLLGGDIAELRRRSDAVAERLQAGSEVRITCAHGTDLRFSIEGRDAISDGGELDAPGAFGNLPCGEAFVAPVEGTAGGTLVIDGSIAGVGLVSGPVRMTVRGGHLANAEGEAGSRLLELLTAHGPDGTNVAELGIGTNADATLTGNILEDEKILGTAHIAFGASAAIGGTVQVPVHLDCIALEPAVAIDGETVLRGGELLV